MRIRFLLRAAALLVAVLIVLRVVGRPIASPALGYIAKVTCSQVFLGGITPSAAIGELPKLGVTAVIRTTVDVSTGRVRASVPLIASRAARFHPGLGCTLVPTDGDPVQFPAMPAVASAPDSVNALPWPQGDQPRAQLPEGIDAAGLDSTLTRAFREPASGGERNTRAIVVVHRGRIVAERYAEGFSAENRYPGWSMTKSVGSALVGVLVKEGKLSLDMNGLFAPWRATADPRASITLRQMLWMSDGLAADESYAPTGGATKLLFGSRDIGGAAMQAGQATAPGSTWYYSSATSNLISQLVRDSVGGSLEQYLTFPRRVLFDKLGMQSAVMEPDATGLYVASSFMYATARDWARFGQLYLQDGVWNGERILPEGWVEFSRTPAPAAPLGQYGGQWWLNAGAANDSSKREFPRLPRELYYASGFEGQTVAVIPSRDLVVVRLGLSRPDDAYDLTELIGGVLEAIR
ncbi:MAG: serine hydrolase [Gemmatimonadaceae bacterium]|nr:serine hydrolase [Gemmatimonadaceae bacterium]